MDVTELTLERRTAAAEEAYHAWWAQRQVGGNNYGWFASNEFPFLAFDNASLTYVGSGSELAIGRNALFASMFFDDPQETPEPASALLRELQDAT